MGVVVHSPPLAPSDMIRGYRVVRVLGAGAFGRVLEAQDAAGSAVAIKETQCWQEIENEVKILLNEAYDRAKHILKTHEKELHTLANKLLEEETLSGKQIHTLLNIKMPGKAKEKGAVASSA